MYRFAAIASKVNKWCGAIYGAMSQSPSGKMMTLLPSWWRRNFILTETAVLWILLCFFYCPPPHDSTSFLIHILVTITVFYTLVLLIKIFNLQRKKINRTSKDNGIPWSPSTPLSGSCWTSRIFNGLLKTQLRCHLRDSVLGRWTATPWDLYALKEPPLPGAASPTARKNTQI